MSIKLLTDLVTFIIGFYFLYIAGCGVFGKEIQLTNNLKILLFSALATLAINNFGVRDDINILMKEIHGNSRL